MQQDVGPVSAAAVRAALRGEAAVALGIATWWVWGWGVLGLLQASVALLLGVAALLVSRSGVRADVQRIGACLIGASLSGFLLLAALGPERADSIPLIIARNFLGYGKPGAPLVLLVGIVTGALALVAFVPNRRRPGDE